jgi:hypothetical protein
MATINCKNFVWGQSGAGLTASLRSGRDGAVTVWATWTKFFAGMHELLAYPDYVGTTATGITKEFFKAIETATIAAGITPLYNTGAGLIRPFSPEKARQVRQNLTTAVSNVTMVADVEIASVTVSPVSRRISQITMTNGDVYVISGHVFECSYEGDAARLAGVPRMVGREGNQMFGEIFAGVNATSAEALAKTHSARVIRASTGGLWRGCQYPPLLDDGKCDNGIMSWDWRIVYDSSSSRLPWIAPNRPSGLPYVAADFRDIVDGFNVNAYGTDPSASTGIANTQIDNIASGIRSDDTITPTQYPSNGNEIVGVVKNYHRLTKKADRLKEWSKMFYRAHGTYYAAANDPASPAGLRTSCAAFGMPADTFQTEYFGTPGWPPMPYIRETPRFWTQQILTFDKIMTGAAAPAHPVFYGGYGVDAKTVNEFPLAAIGSTEEGAIDDTGRSGHYPVAAENLLPDGRIASNLIICVPIGCSRKVLGSYRIEPTYMLAGEAAAIMAKAANDAGVPVTSLPYGAYSGVLSATGLV